MIRIEDLNVVYGGGAQRHVAVDGVSIEVEAGQFYTLLGPSGCGKTTTLRCVAGLHRPDGGRIVVGRTAVVDAGRGVWVPPNRRRIGMVFQSYAIWPHLSVFDNVAFPLRRLRPRPPRAEIERRALDALALVKLDGLHGRAATDLSGGQQQRLALARALVGEPQVLLLDEPLSNLDAKLREEMRQELKALTKRLGVTTLFVTHEQVEALTMSDRIAVMHDGRIDQEGTPLEIYSAPCNPFVADFVGKTNLVKGRVRGSEPHGSDYLTAIDTEIGILLCRSRQPHAPSLGVTIAIRPENIVADDAAAPDAANTLAGEVVQVSYIGNLSECGIAIGNQTMRVQFHPGRAPRAGTALRVRIDPAHCQVLA
ncbi:MAG: ABC transporter ATP-binding protein [Rhodospirillales bacterium]